MPRPTRSLRAAALVLAAASGLAAAPSLATADTFAGGALAPGAVRADGTRTGTLAAVTAETRGTAATVGVRVIANRCYTGGVQRLRAPLTDPVSWSSIAATRTVTTRDDDGGRGRLRIVLALRRVAPDALAGTVTLTGRQARGRGRPKGRCRGSYAVVLRSSAPAARAGTALGTARYGPTDQRVSGGIHGALVMRAVSSRRHVALWTARESCSSGGARRPARSIVNTDARFTVGADGRFRHTDRERSRRGRYGYRFTGTIEGRIGADGIARGTVRTREVTTKSGGYYAVVCTSPRSRFVATP